jgi:hypothetical protein
MYNIFAIIKPSISQGTPDLPSVSKEAAANYMVKESKFCTCTLPCNFSLLFTL